MLKPVFKKDNGCLKGTGKETDGPRQDRNQRVCGIKKRKKAQGKAFKRIKTAAAALGIATAFVLVAFAILYASGSAGLYGSAEKAAPDAGLLAERRAAEDIRLKNGLAAVQWQDDWVAVDGKVYSYDSRRINLLVLGVDKAGKMEREPDYEKWRAGQTDAIFVVSLDPAEKKASIIGVPRNSMVEVDIYDREGHISSTIFDQICLQYPYAGGAAHGLEKAAEAVSELLYGLPIHGTAAIGYEAVSKINDMAGGVDVVALESLKTPFGNYEKGERLHLEGEYVLAYVKARDTGIIGSPTMRLERQKQYLAALAGKMKEEIKANPMRVKEMYDAVAGYVNTDIGINEMVYLATQAAGYQFSGEDIYLLEGEDKAVPITKDGEETGDFYDDLYLDEDNLKETMIRVFYKEVRLEE